VRNTSSLLLIWGTYCGETKAPASICFKPLAEKERNYTDDGGDYVDGGDYGDYVDGDDDIGDDNDNNDSDDT